MNEISGMVLINKPKNITSFDAVSIIKNTLGTKARHIGTLDPMATGLLVVLLGNATKLNSHLVEHNKEYIAKAKLFAKSNSQDLETQVIIDQKNLDKYQNDKDFPNKLENVIKNFKGQIEMEVPLYSSIKVNGKKLYEYARNNEKVILPKRISTIDSIDLLSFDNKHMEIQVKLKVSSGTYIRSVLDEIAKKFDSNAVMTDLIRTNINRYNLDDSIDLLGFEILSGSFRKNNNINKQEQIDKINELSKILKQKLEKNIILEQDILKTYQKDENLDIIELNDNLFKKFENGVKIKVNLPQTNKVIIKNNGKLKAIAKVKDQYIIRDFVIKN